MRVILITAGGAITAAWEKKKAGVYPEYQNDREIGENVTILLEEQRNNRKTREESNNDGVVRIDFEDDASFEAALNKGEIVDGKTVKFKVLKVTTIFLCKPDDQAGFNLWAGEHLNFVSSEKFEACEGQVITAKVYSVIKARGCHWYIVFNRIPDELTQGSKVASSECKTAGNEEDKKRDSEAKQSIAAVDSLEDEEPDHFDPEDKDWDF